MRDEGFDFKPAERREPKRFEPPPWEREAFEQLEKVKQDEPRDSEEGPGSEEPSCVPQAGPREPQPAAQEGPAPGAERPAEKAGIEERVMIEMLAALAQEEPPAKRQFYAVGMASALVLVSLGGVLIVWGVAALVGASRTGTVGQFGGTVLLAFGAGFVASAAWLAYRSLKQRGVL